jgi:hypothetical protein
MVMTTGSNGGTNASWTLDGGTTDWTAYILKFIVEEIDYNVLAQTTLRLIHSKKGRQWQKKYRI